MLLRLVLGWTCVGVFIATAIITLLALVKIIKLADKKYLDRLFAILIVEVIVVGVGAFTGFVQGPAKVEEKVRNAGRTALAEQLLPDIEIIARSGSRDRAEPASAAAQRAEEVLKETLKKGKD
jgi:hypothetical protein